MAHEYKVCMTVTGNDEQRRQLLKHIPDEFQDLEFREKKETTDFFFWARGWPGVEEVNGAYIDKNAPYHGPGPEIVELSKQFTELTFHVRMTDYCSPMYLKFKAKNGRYWEHSSEYLRFEDQAPEPLSGKLLKSLIGGAVMKLQSASQILADYWKTLPPQDDPKVADEANKRLFKITQDLIVFGDYAETYGPSTQI